MELLGLLWFALFMALLPWMWMSYVWYGGSDGAPPVRATEEGGRALDIVSLSQVITPAGTPHGRAGTGDDTDGVIPKASGGRHSQASPAHPRQRFVDQTADLRQCDSIGSRHPIRCCGHTTPPPSTCRAVEPSLSVSRGVQKYVQ